MYAVIFRWECLIKWRHYTKGTTGSIDASISEAPILDFSSVETLGQLVTVLGAFGKTKEEGSILSPSFLTTLLTVSVLW